MSNRYLQASEILRRLAAPVVAAPLYIASTLELVAAQCRSGIMGSFPALNAREPGQLDEWLAALNEMRNDDLSLGKEFAPHAVNLVFHPLNKRLSADIAACVKAKAPVVITSMSPPTEILPAIHEYGGVVFHDVVSVRHARKAVEAGVDGLILVCAGAGGHGGTLSPFGFVSEVRSFFDGPLIVGGAISNGRAIAAVKVLGADASYVGTPWLGANEANVTDDHRAALFKASADSITYTDHFTGVHANFLSDSIKQIGLDPRNLPAHDPTLDYHRGTNTKAKVWLDIWSAGHGVHAVQEKRPAATIAEQLVREFESSCPVWTSK